MTLKKQILTLVVLPMALGATNAHAGFERVEERGQQQGQQGGFGIEEGNQNHGGFGHGGGRGPLPPMPTPRPPIPPPNGGGGWQPMPPGPTPYPGNGGAMYEQRSIALRYYVNYDLNLIDMLNLRYMPGYAIQSVIVNARGGDYGAQIMLWANNRVEASVFQPLGAVNLFPSMPVMTGQYSDARLLVRNGGVNIDSIVVNLVRVGGRF